MTTGGPLAQGRDGVLGDWCSGVSLVIRVLEPVSMVGIRGHRRTRDTVEVLRPPRTVGKSL